MNMKQQSQLSEVLLHINDVLLTKYAAFAKYLTSNRIQRGQRDIHQLITDLKKKKTSSVYDCTVEDVEYICNSNSNA